MDLGLTGLRALVTGGAKGIGRSVADILAGEGAHVGVCARNAAEVEATVAALQAQGVTAFGRAVDVAERTALEAWVADGAAALGAWTSWWRTSRRWPSPTTRRRGRPASPPT